MRSERPMLRKSPVVTAYGAEPVEPTVRSACAANVVDVNAHAPVPGTAMSVVTISTTSTNRPATRERAVRHGCGVRGSRDRRTAGRAEPCGDANLWFARTGGWDMA